MFKLGVISQERLKIEVKFLLGAYRKSYMPGQLTQQRMTLSDLEWPFHISRIARCLCGTYYLSFFYGIQKLLSKQPQEKGVDLRQGPEETTVSEVYHR